MQQVTSCNKLERQICLKAHSPGLRQFLAIFFVSFSKYLNFCLDFLVMFKKWLKGKFNFQNL